MNKVIGLGNVLTRLGFGIEFNFVGVLKIKDRKGLNVVYTNPYPMVPNHVLLHKRITRYIELCLKNPGQGS